MKHRVVNLRAGEIVELRYQGKPTLLALIDRDREDFTLYYSTPNQEIIYDAGTRARVMLEASSNNA